MVTQNQVRDYIGKKPFKAFRLVLKDGRNIDVARQLMAIAMPKRVLVGIDNHMREIPLDNIDRVEFIEVSTQNN